MASFPDSVRVFTPVKDGDVIRPVDVNDLQDEVTSTQRSLGPGASGLKDRAIVWYPDTDPSAPGDRTYVAFKGTDTTLVPGWSISDRLDNVEKAALRNLGGLYLSVSGGSVRPTGSTGISITPTHGGQVTALSVHSSVGSDPVVAIGTDGSVTGRTAQFSSPGGGTVSINAGSKAVSVGSGATYVDQSGDVHVGSNSIRAGSTGTQLTITSPTDSSDSILVTNSGGMTRSALRVSNGGSTTFNVHTNGYVNCGTLDSSSSELRFSGKSVLTSHELSIVDVSLSSSALYLGAGSRAEYSKDRVVLSSGTRLTSTGLTFPGQAVVSASSVTLPDTTSASVTVSGNATLSSSYLKPSQHLVNGSLYAKTSTVAGVESESGLWHTPYAADTGSATRDIQVPFSVGPNGAVKVTTSCKVRAYSRWTTLSYEIRSSSGTLVASPSDTWGLRVNASTPSVDETDIYEVRLSNAHIHQLSAGSYKLHVKVAASDQTGVNSSVSRIKLSGLKVLVEPLLSQVTQVTHG